MVNYRELLTNIRLRIYLSGQLKKHLHQIKELSFPSTSRAYNFWWLKIKFFNFVFILTSSDLIKYESFGANIICYAYTTFYPKDSEGKSTMEARAKIPDTVCWGGILFKSLISTRHISNYTLSIKQFNCLPSTWWTAGLHYVANSIFHFILQNFVSHKCERFFYSSEKRIPWLNSMCFLILKIVVFFTFCSSILCYVSFYQLSLEMHTTRHR